MQSFRSSMKRQGMTAVRMAFPPLSFFFSDRRVSKRHLGFLPCFTEELNQALRCLNQRRKSVFLTAHYKDLSSDKAFHVKARPFSDRAGKQRFSRYSFD